MGKDNFAVVRRQTAEIALEHDGELILSTGRDRFETKWKNTQVAWSKLLGRLSDSIKTRETHAEYMRMGKERQDKIKDIGGFVGGHLKHGRRKNGNVAARQIVTLDLDFAPSDFLERVNNNFDISFAWAVYSTHKHAPKNPRFRLVIPLSRPVSADEYEAIARRVADQYFDIEWFDDSTFQPTRLMYWPSHSSDVTPAFDYADLPFLDADGVLSQYADWSDVSFWAYSTRVDGVRKKDAKRAGDPLAKEGVIGAFNRAYSIPEAIEAFLSDVYTPTASEDRYTYAAGSTASGLVIYEDGAFAYSNHSTDPAGGRLCNAFDLVRIHKFGGLDDDARPETPPGKLPSFRQMQMFAAADKKVKRAFVEEQAQAFDEIEADEYEDDGEAWTEKLTLKKNGALEPILTNVLLILLNDKRLKSIRYNELSGGIEAGTEGMPWARRYPAWENDDSEELYAYISGHYGTQFPKDIFNTALTVAARKRRFHPIHEYLKGLPDWDGVERIPTLLIDYLGAEDSQYVREVTRKVLAAAIARVKRPGVKFDNMLVVVGDQGIGKSTLFAKLGGPWLSDSLTMTDMRDKSGAEKLQGYWIVEVGELAGMRKAEIESMKSFISRQEDIYRPAYGRRTERHPRQCIIVGSTNSATGFLRDVTGNRRFWPVAVSGDTDGRHPWDLRQEDVKQIWAEALTLYDRGERLMLSAEAEEEAREKQKAAMEEDPRRPMVEEYLSALLPEGWDDLEIADRRDYLDGVSLAAGKGVTVRQTVSNIEIWCECFGRRECDISKKDAHEIASIMATIPGWERSGKRQYLPKYGRQRLYERKQKYDF